MVRPPCRNFEKCSHTKCFCTFLNSAFCLLICPITSTTSSRSRWRQRQGAVTQLNGSLMIEPSSGEPRSTNPAPPHSRILPWNSGSQVDDAPPRGFVESVQALRNGQEVGPASSRCEIHSTSLGLSTRLNPFYRAEPHDSLLFILVAGDV